MTAKEKSTKEVILEAAIELISMNGFHGTSMRQLARAVGIKESSIYHHFINKDGIMDEILNFHIRSFHEAAPPQSVVLEISRNYIDPVEFWMAIIAEFLKRVPPLVEKTTIILANEMYLNDKCRRFVADTLFDAQKKMTEMSLRFLNQLGMIKECNYNIVAAQYVYMLYGLETENRLKVLDGESREDIRDNFNKHIEYFIRNLS